MGGNDWVEVRLSKFGEQYAGGAPIRVHEGQQEFVFQPGEKQRVTRAFDWERVLKHVTVGGVALFEIVAAQPEPEELPPLQEMLEKPQRGAAYLKDKGEQA